MRVQGRAVCAAQVRAVAPRAFHELRRLFGIAPAAFTASVGQQALVERFTEGKSGAFLYFSADKRYIMKTATAEEMDTMLSLLPHYHAHVQAAQPAPMHPCPHRHPDCHPHVAGGQEAGPKPPSLALLQHPHSTTPTPPLPLALPLTVSTAHTWQAHPDTLINRLLGAYKLRLYGQDVAVIVIESSFQTERVIHEHCSGWKHRLKTPPMRPRPGGSRGQGTSLSSPE